MSITLIVGPMFSGKTTELIRLVDRKHIAGKKCVIIKHSMDQRYDGDCQMHVTTHSQYSYRNTDILSVGELTEDLVNLLVNTKNVVAIEEGHFFPKLSYWCNYIANQGIDVIVSALDGNYRQEPFEEVSKLSVLAENVNKLSAVCMRCRELDGHFTIRTIDSEEQILVGGSDIYQSVCRRCLGEFRRN